MVQYTYPLMQCCYLSLISMFLQSRVVKNCGILVRCLYSVDLWSVIIPSYKIPEIVPSADTSDYPIVDVFVLVRMIVASLSNVRALPRSNFGSAGVVINCVLTIIDCARFTLPMDIASGIPSSIMLTVFLYTHTMLNGLAVLN